MFRSLEKRTLSALIISPSVLLTLSAFLVRLRVLLRVLLQFAQSDPAHVSLCVDPPIRQELTSDRSHAPFDLGTNLAELHEITSRCMSVMTVRSAMSRGLSFSIAAVRTTKMQPKPPKSFTAYMAAVVQ